MDEQDATPSGPVDEPTPAASPTPAALPTASHRSGRALKAAGLVTAGVLAGGTLAATMSAVAAESPTPTPATTSSSGSPESPAATSAPRDESKPDGAKGPGGSDPVRSDEKALTGAELEKAQAAALKAVPGGTVVRAETDAGDAEYEVHMTKSDGTPVTVKLDKSFVVTAVQDGMGAGDPGMAGPKGPRPDGQAPPDGQARPDGQAPPAQEGTSGYSSGA